MEKYSPEKSPISSQFCLVVSKLKYLFMGTTLDWTKLAETKLAWTKLAGLKCLETKSSETKTVPY